MADPEAVGSVLRLEVVDLARGGAGVARAASGRVVFVAGAMTGDAVRARVTRKKKRVLFAELVEVVRPAPGRLEPRCPAFGRCGGCQWQHVPYELQWATKVRGVAEALRRVAIEPPSPPDEFPAARVWEYRNRVQLRGRGRRLGFREARGHGLVPVDRCDLARPEINAAWEEIRRRGERVGGSYLVEVQVPDGGGKPRLAWDADRGAGGFRQVHDEQNEALRGWVAGAAGAGALLLDLFGGRGNLSAPLVGRFDEVHCVDTGGPAGAGPASPGAGGPPREGADGGASGPGSAAAGGGGPAVRFHREPVRDWLAAFAADARRARGDRPPDLDRVAVLDPPRRGLGDDGAAVTAACRDAGVGVVVLVHCDPDAHARDLAAFLKRGYDLDRTAVLDFFPQTKHVEAMARLVWEL